MSDNENHGRHAVHAGMTLLEVIDRFRQTEDVLRKYDEEAGVCLCCEALFESLGETAEKYGLDLDRLISELEDEIRRTES